jgi:hypothetical protein
MLMRTTKTEMHQIIKCTRNAIDDSREAIHRADALLRASNDWISSVTIPATLPARR